MSIFDERVKYHTDQVIKLTAREYDALKALIDNAPEPNAKLKAMARKYGQKRSKVKRNRSALYSSNSDQWYTPPEIIDWIKTSGYTIGLDPCTSEENPTGAQFFLTRDGLSAAWDRYDVDMIYLNPPYGRSIGAWVDKLLATDLSFVALVPARTDTAWWARLVEESDTLWLRSGRIHFLDRDGVAGESAPFPSAIFTRNAELRGHMLWTAWCVVPKAMPGDP